MSRGWLLVLKTYPQRSTLPDEPLLQTYSPLVSVGTVVSPVTPRQRATILLCSEGRTVLSDARWGLIPRWVEHPNTFKLNLTEAPLETVSDTHAFARPFEKRRCFVAAARVTLLVDGEPRRVTKRDHTVLLLAGIYERKRGAGGTHLSFALLTAASEGKRLPAVLTRGGTHAWLADGHLAGAPYGLWEPADRLKLEPVGREVGET